MRRTLACCSYTRAPGDARREEQSHRFDEVKKIRDERDQQMMRAIEVRPDVAPAPPD